MDYLASMERNMEIYNKRKEGATLNQLHRNLVFQQKEYGKKVECQK